MLKMNDILEKAGDYILISHNHASEEFLNKLPSSSASEHYLLIANSLTIFRREFVEIFKKYYASEIFYLSNYFLGTYQEPFIFLHIISSPVKRIKIASYNAPPHPYRDDWHDPDHNVLRRSDKYYTLYQTYLKSLDSWRQTGVIPQETENCQYRSIDVEDFYSEVIYPSFYMPRYDNIRQLLKSEKWVELSDVAEVETVMPINSDIETDEKVFWTLDTHHRIDYPYLPEKDVIRGSATSVKLHKGDILVYNFYRSDINTSYFLLDKEIQFDLYAPKGTQVIHAKNVCPEYLFEFLKSKVAWEIDKVFNIPVWESRRSISRNLKQTPIVLPTEDDAVYKERFERISAPDKRYYQIPDMFQNETTIAERLSNEYIEALKLNNTELLKKQIIKDRKEVIDCYRVQAYKATIILIGSILEVFLLDWIAEIDGVDYFDGQHKKKITYYNKDGKAISKNADFADYIKIINEKYDSLWSECAKKANHIRKKRNEVHTQLIIKRAEEITNDTCKDAIDNLLAIFDSRLELMK